MKNTALKLTGAAGAVLMLIAALSLTGTDLPRENGPSSPSSSPHSTSSSGFSPSPTLPQGESASGPPSSIGSSIGTPGATGGQTAAGSSHAGASTSPSHPGAGNSQSNKPSGDSAISSGTTGNTAGSSSSGQTTTTTTGPTTTSPSVTPSGKIIAGYYAGWSSYKGYTPDKIPANRLTHLHYAFAKIDPSANAVALADPSNDRKNFAALRKLKQRQPALKTLISIGGWDYSTYFFRRSLLSGAEGSLRPELPGIYSGTRLRRHRSGLGISRFGRIGGKHQPAAG